MKEDKEKKLIELTNSIAEGIYTVKKFAAKNKDRGTWPDSESAIWALRAGSPQNGFSEAFVTIGRRVLINEEKLWKAVALLQGGKNVR